MSQHARIGISTLGAFLVGRLFWPHAPGDLPHQGFASDPHRSHTRRNLCRRLRFWESKDLGGGVCANLRWCHSYLTGTLSRLTLFALRHHMLYRGRSRDLSQVFDSGSCFGVPRLFLSHFPGPLPSIVSAYIRDLPWGRGGVSSLAPRRSISQTS